MRDLGIKFMVAQWDDVGNVIFLFFWMNSLWTDGYLCPSQILKFACDTTLAVNPFH